MKILCLRHLNNILKMRHCGDACFKSAFSLFVSYFTILVVVFLFSSPLIRKNTQSYMCVGGKGKIKYLFNYIQTRGCITIYTNLRAPTYREHEYTIKPKREYREYYMDKAYRAVIEFTYANPDASHTTAKTNNKKMFFLPRINT